VAAFDVSGLSFTYPNGTPALRDVTVAAAGPGVIGLIGRNGSGKTTFARHLNGLLRPTRGRVLLNGADTAGRTTAALARTVGYAFQNPDNQIFHRTVAEEVAFGPRNLGCAPSEVDARVAQALEILGLTPLRHQHPRDLVFSHRKLVALASVLAMDTPVVVLDEPTTGQDWDGLTRIERAVADLASRGALVLLITHDMDLVARACGRVWLFAAGRLAADGAPEDVFADDAGLAAAWVEAPEVMRLGRAAGITPPPLTVDALVNRLAGG
jgi:energy-coupling factor transport system ATP-binding protein